MKNFRALLRDVSGASAAEYTLLVAILGTGIAIAAATLGGAISSSMGDSETQVETCGGGC